MRDRYWWAANKIWSVNKNNYKICASYAYIIGLVLEQLKPNSMSNYLKRQI